MLQVNVHKHYSNIQFSNCRKGAYNSLHYLVLMFFTLFLRACTFSVLVMTCMCTQQVYFKPVHFIFSYMSLETNKQNQKYMQFLRFVLVLFQFRSCVMMLSVVLPRVLIQIGAHFMIRYYLLALDTNLICEKCPSNQKTIKMHNRSISQNSLKMPLILSPSYVFFGNLQWFCRVAPNLVCAVLQTSLSLGQQAYR